MTRRVRSRLEFSRANEHPPQRVCKQAAACVTIPIASSGAKERWNGSRKDLTFLVYGHQPLQSHPVARQSIVAFGSIGEIKHAVVGGAHVMLQPLIDVSGAPLLAPAILDPLVVRDRDATRVGKHIRQNRDASPLENGFPLGRQGAIGSFGDDAHLERLGLAFSNLILEGCRNEDVGGQLEEVVARNALAIGIPSNGTVTLYVRL